MNKKLILILVTISLCLSQCTSNLPVLSVMVTPQVMEGDAVFEKGGIVTIEVEEDRDLVVELKLSQEGLFRVSIPGYVTIPASKTSASFDITVFDNAEQDGHAEVEISAVAPGFETGKDTLIIMDND